MAYDPNVNYREVARRKALKYGLDPDIFVRQIGAESAFDPDVISGRTASSAGAQGIAQIMPATARGWGVNPLKPRHALDAAAKNMAAYVKRYGSYENALRAYNAGPGAIQASRGYAETNAYVQKILGGRDPGQLGEPQSPGSRRSSRRGRPDDRRGTPTVVPGRPPQPAALGALSVGAPDMGALTQLLAGADPQPQQATPIATPEFSAARYLPGNGLPVQSMQAPQQQEDGLAAKLAAIGQPSGVLSPVSRQATAGTSTTVIPADRENGGPVGKTLVIGDSLQEGTFPLLKNKLGDRVRGISARGKSSSWGIQQLKREFRAGKYDNVVFDLGTNDGSVNELRQSLSQLTRIAGGAKVYVSTVNSPYDETEKNRLIRAYARNNDNVEVIKWRGATRGGATLPDGIHGQYGKRANVLANALGYSAEPRAGRSWGVKPRGMLLEMFYNGPGNAVNADNGKRVGKGFVPGHGSHVHVGGNPKTIVEIGRMAQRMGLTVLENKAFDRVDPVHTAGSLHYSNQAADISGDPRKMAALTRRVARLYGI